MDLQDLIIRAAVIEDAEGIGRLHVRAWQAAYRGVMPDEYLDGLRVGDRVEMWRGRIAESDLPPLLVAVVAGEVVGFAAFGAEQPPTAHRLCGELYAMKP